MPYLFTCPHCQAKTRVDDRYSGLSGECAVCGKAITVPEFIEGPLAAISGNEGGMRGPFPAVWIVLALLGIALAVGGAVAVYRYGGETVAQLQAGNARRASIRNLEKIAVALRAYASDHGTFPPPATTDVHGKPLHSWRVLILPYLDEESLYDEIDLSRPWDDPVHQDLAYQMPSVYRHPSHSPAPTSSIAAYCLVTGPGTLFPPAGPLGPDAALDGADKTLLVVEAAPLASSWAEPIDVDFTRLRGSVDGSVDAIGGLSDGGAAVVTVDGRGHFLGSSFPNSDLRALVTPAGGEPLRDDVLDREPILDRNRP